MDAGASQSPLRARIGPAARARPRMEPDHYKQATYEESPGWHAGKGAATEARNNREAQIKQKQAFVAQHKHAVGDRTVAGVKRKRDNVREAHKKSMTDLHGYEFDVSSALFKAMEKEDGTPEEKATNRQKFIDLKAYVNKKTSEYNEQLKSLEQQLDTEEAWLTKFESQQQQLQALQAENRRAQVTNAVVRGAAKVARTASNLASAITGRDREGADVNVT